jgi:hypothetical protein
LRHKLIEATASWRRTVRTKRADEILAAWDEAGMDFGDEAAWSGGSNGSSGWDGLNDGAHTQTASALAPGAD